MKIKKVCGLEFIDEELKIVVDAVADLAKSEQAGYVVTPNPEIMLKTWSNPGFAKIIEGAALKIADGFGLQWADWFNSRYSSLPKLFKLILLYPSVLWFAILRPNKNIISRCTGVDLMDKLLVWYERLPVFLLGAAPGVAEAVVKEYPFANIVGCFSGSPAEDAEKELIEKINKTDAKLLFVAYGAPKQELWMARNLSKLKNVKVAIGVGGSFDYLSGGVKRAPGFLRKLGLEWLYRLIKQPERVMRIVNAVIVFPWRVVFN